MHSDTLVSYPAVYSPNTCDGDPRSDLSTSVCQIRLQVCLSYSQVLHTRSPGARVACVNRPKTEKEKNKTSRNRRLMDCQVCLQPFWSWSASATCYVICLMSHGTVYMFPRRVLEECLLNKLSYVLCLYPPVVYQRVNVFLWSLKWIIAIFNGYF